MTVLTRPLCLLSLALYFLIPSIVLADTYWVSTDGADTNTGNSDFPFRNISKAASIARAGDTVLVRPGIYRERVIPDRGGLDGKPIVFKSEVQHGAIIKGSDLWEPEWLQIQQGVYGAVPDPELFTDSNYVDGGNPYLINYHCNRPPYPYKSVFWTLGQVFVNGEQFMEVSNMEELSSGLKCWWFNAVDQRIEIQFGELDPASQMVEITTRRGVFRPVRPGLSYIEVHGFILEHCANQLPYRFWDSEYRQNAQSGLIGTRGGHHWVIRNNVIRYAKSIGLDICKLLTDNELHTYPSGSVEAGNHLIEDNVFFANGTCGVMGMRHRDVVISNNVFVENNYYRHTTYEVGGIKTHYATDMLIEGNWFVNNETMACWLDNTWTNCRFTRNICIGNRGYDLFFELDDNTFANPSIADHNLFLGGRPGFIAAPEFEGDVADPWQPWSCGIYSHDADGMILAHNLFTGTAYGIYSRDIPGRRGTVSYRKVFGNIFSGEDMVPVCYPIEFPPEIKENYFYENVYPETSGGFVLHGYFGDTTPNPEALLKIPIQLCKNACEGPTPVTSPWGPADNPWGYRIPFSQWSCITGFDQKSKLRDIICTYNETLEVTLPSELKTIEARYANINRDFLGYEFTNEVIPGPFQGLRGGRNMIILTPESPWLRDYMLDKGIIND